MQGSRKKLILLGGLGLALIVSATVYLYFSMQYSSTKKKADAKTEQKVSDITNKNLYAYNPSDSYISDLTKFAASTKDTQERQKAFMALGNAYDAKGDFAKAIDEYNLARKEMDSTGATVNEKTDLDDLITRETQKKQFKDNSKPVIIPNGYSEPDN